jgi:O-acetyl-ADP-ribose deacetylase (regulator of RNase III)
LVLANLEPVGVIEMLKELSGDLLLSRAAAIAHGVAPNDPFSHGLALSLREKAPSLYKDFRHYCQTHHPRAGSLWTWAGSDGVRIVNLFTQEAVEGHHGGSPGRASVSNVSHALKALRQLVEAEQLQSLALPRLATGVGGLQWDDVRPLIAQHLGDLHIPVYIYATYHAGVAGKEA